MGVGVMLRLESEGEENGGKKGNFFLFLPRLLLTLFNPPNPRCFCKTKMTTKHYTKFKIWHPPQKNACVAGYVYFSL